MLTMQLLSNKIKRKTLVRIIATLGIVLLPVIILLSFFVATQGRIYPNIRVAGIDVSGKTPEEAQKLVADSFMLPSSITLVTSSGESHTISTSSINADLDWERTIQDAYAFGRSGDLSKDLHTLLGLIGTRANFTPHVTTDKRLVYEQLSAYAESVTNAPVEPTVVLIGGEISVSPGESGTEVDIQEIEEQIIEYLKNGSTEPITVEITQIDKKLSDEQILEVKLRAQKVLDKKMVLSFEHQTFTFDGEQLLALIEPFGGYRKEAINQEVMTLANTINRPSQNPVFTFADGRVQEFKPAKDGIEVNKEKLTAMIIDSLEDLENEGQMEVAYVIPVDSTSPDISMDDVNNMGIKELIGRGTSQFKGSIPSRVYNINLAASRLNGVLIKPGEEFSFNGALGDVSALTGYKQAYVIQGGRTVLGDGGGVCQVSTTFFRAALNAGLPVIERNPHSYRVGYYEQDSGPGLDASIYVPTLDLKIKNDTPGHILVQAIPDLANMTLVFELYGTSDGRVATVGKPIVTSQSAPPEPLYIDDPTKPTGYQEQIDYAAWGAKAQFDYKVERNGEVLIEKTFFSNYRPWQAKFIRGTGPAV